MQMLFTRVLAKSNELRMLVLEEVGMDHRSCRIMANQLMCARAAAVCVCETAVSRCNNCVTLQTVGLPKNQLGDMGCAVLLHALSQV